MLPRKSFCSFAVLLSTVVVLAADGVPVHAAPFGPRPGAELSIDKLSPIGDFINGEVVFKLPISFLSALFQHF